jgi:acyl carrier protein
VTRGYLRRPELTAERFIPHPFRREPGARLYRTGDLARYRPDGTVEFLGRADHQVKIRGHRIELEEIEHALRRHPGVREAVVVAREDAPGDLRLAGYVAATRDPAPSPSGLREFVARSLPAIMVPASVIVLDALPRTPNGKLDRRALPLPGQVPAERETPVAAPRTPVEAALADIWKRVLQVEQVGVEDSFFDLGGNSLTTIQVAFGIRRAFEIELPLQTILTAPTLSALAARVEEQLLEQVADTTLAELLGEVDQLSDEEARALAQEEIRAASPGSTPRTAS